MSNDEDKWNDLPGKLVVISGPSGSGKSTLVGRLLDRRDMRIEISVSATTRPPRPGEENGRHYYFMSEEEFVRNEGELLEQALVHGHHYGTPAQPVRQAMARGMCVLLVIDVQGGFQVKEKVPGAMLIFIEPPSPKVLEARLRARRTDDDATIERRLATARRELESSERYDVRLVNDELDQAVDELASILIRNGCGTRDEHD
jgi:guanylate kinase